MSMMRKQTPELFSECVAQLAANVSAETKAAAPLVSEPFADFVRTHADALDSMIVQERDMEYEYFGIRTLEGSYLLRV